MASADQFSSPEKDFSQTRKRSSTGSAVGESPVKKRLGSSFWKKQNNVEEEPLRTTEEDTGDRMEEVKIDDLVLGVHYKKSLVFRVTVLGRLKQGASSYLKFHAIDSSGEVSVVVYENAPAVAAILKVNGTFKLENFEVQREPLRYPQYTTSSLQVKLLQDSKVLEHSAEGIPDIPFAFIPIGEIFSQCHHLNSRIDVFGVIAEEWGLESTALGKSKRDVRITDERKDEVILTLWEDVAEHFEGKPGQAIALRKAVIREYKGDRLLNATGCTLIWVNPDLQDNRPRDIVDWFVNETK